MAINRMFRTCPSTGLVYHEPAEKQIRWNAVAGVLALLVGGILALRVTTTRWQAIHLLPPDWFYLVLTAHGLDMLVFWIIFFEIAVLYFCASTLLRCRLATPRWAWAAFWLMIIGALVNNVAVFRGESSVIFTSYAPMGAHPAFYLGLILFAVGALIACFVFFGTLVIAKSERTYTGSVPLVTFGAAATVLDERNVRTVPWSFFSLQGEHLGSQVTAEFRIATLPMASEQVGFLPSPKAVPFRNSGPDVLKLSIHIRLDLLGRSPVKLENHVWFDPRDGTPLYLIRTRFGLDDYHQRFRFTREGVFRRQREPGSAAQAAGPPESWSKLKEHFFGYPPGEMCIPVLATSTLMYLLYRVERNLGVTQKEGGELADLAVTAVAVDDDFLGHHAGGKDGGQVVSVAIIIQLPGTRDMPLLVMAVVAGIKENYEALLVSRVLEKTINLVTIRKIQPFLLEPGGDFVFTLSIHNTSVEAVTISALTDDNALSAECLALVGTSIPADGTVSCSYTVNYTDAGSYPNTASSLCPARANRFSMGSN